MEEKKKLAVAFSPHITAPGTVTTIMLDVIIALIPACIASIYYFGWSSLLTIAVSVAAAVGGEALLQLILKKPIAVGDLSAAVTGLLVALNMPAEVPLYLPIVGSLFAILIVKQCFGGLGYNFVNPALSARAMLMVAWPVAMTTYLAPHAVDGISSATPLAGEGSVELLDLFLGNVGGSIGETCKVALLIGGIYLIIRKVISWRIPVIFIGTVALMTLILNGAAAVPYALLSGGLFLGAFFMATKRFAEYRWINDPERAAQYRRSFRHYTEENLLVSMFIYAIASALFLGVFIVRYRLELVLAFPILAGFYGYYLYVGLKPNSTVQNPEHLYRERGLMAYLTLCLGAFLLLMFWDMPWLYEYFKVAPPAVESLWKF